MARRGKLQSILHALDRTEEGLKRFIASALAKGTSYEAIAKLITERSRSEENPKGIGITGQAVRTWCLGWHLEIQRIVRDIKTGEVYTPSGEET